MGRNTGGLYPGLTIAAKFDVSGFGREVRAGTMGELLAIEPSGVVLAHFPGIGGFYLRAEQVERVAA